MTAKQYRHSEQWKSFVKFENGTGLKIKSSFSGLPGQYYLFVLIGNHFQKCGFLQTKRKLKCFVTLNYTNAHWRWQPCLWVTFTLGPEGVPWDVLEHTKGSKDKREEGREGAGEETQTPGWSPSNPHHAPRVCERNALGNPQSENWLHVGRKDLFGVMGIL